MGVKIENATLKIAFDFFFKFLSFLSKGLDKSAIWEF